LTFHGIATAIPDTKQTIKTNQGGSDEMNEEMVQQMMAAAERLAAATETLDRVLGKLDAQQEMLNAKVDRIVAAVEESVTQTTERRETEGTGTDLQQRVVQLEKSNADLKAQASRLTRKTLSPVVSALIGKNEIEGERLDPGVLNKTLAALSVEQRIAVKAELARAGMID
jgi:predicted RNase H-like nuclease (RuvC/YqgF family)